MIVLNMIVKDESEVIERCLNSLLGIIDALVICDTGSTDNTVELINNWKEENNVKGIVLQHEWKNFEHNRNLALNFCKEWILENSDIEKDYICLIDADDQLVLEDNFQLDLDKDQIKINMKFENLFYTRSFLFKANVKSFWQGVVHEQLICEGSMEKLENGYILINRDGARNKDPLKYLNDVVALEKALEDDPENPRYLFYLAQSFRDFGYKIMAEKLYLERFEIEKNIEERYISLLEAAKCRMYRGKNNDKTLNILMKAFCFRPQRLEAAYYIVRYFRQKELYQMGYTFGKSLLDMKIPKDHLFLDYDIYNWKFYDEVGICACWSNDKELFADLYEKILEKEISLETKERIEKDLLIYKK